MVWFSQRPEDRLNERKTNVDKFVQDLGPVVTIEVDWADADGREPINVEGVLIIKLPWDDSRGTSHPTYRVTAPLVRLVHWVGEHYVGLTKNDAQDVADAFLTAEFAKVTTAFGG